jgi:hypothetical protein
MVKNTRIGIHRYRGGSGVTANVIRRLTVCWTASLSTPQMRDGELQQFAEDLVAGSVSLEFFEMSSLAHIYGNFLGDSTIYALLPLTRPIDPSPRHLQAQAEGLIS